MSTQQGKPDYRPAMADEPQGTLNGKRVKERAKSERPSVMEGIGNEKIVP
jgi:hypothetical protein